MAVSRLLSITALGVVLHLAAAPSLADRISVRNGSVIKGKAIVDESHPDQYVVIGEKGKTPIVLKKDRVLGIEAEPSILDEYIVRRKATGRSVSTSAQDEYNLAVWCQEHKLIDLASVHLEAAIKRDPDFGPAHQKLGHLLHDGKWLTPSEMKAAQGFIYFKGKWITPEEKEQRDAEASATAEQQSWMRRLAILKQALSIGPEARSRTAEAQLLDIHDPAAVRPVIRTFGIDDDPTLRKLAAKILGSIAGPDASSALVGRLLSENESDVREATMIELLRTKEANVVPKLVQALRSDSLVVINRAAWALGNLKASSSVPRLISALVSTELRTVWVQPGGGSGIGAGFGTNAPLGGGIATYGAVGGQSIPVLTGPVVGPGVVAYGATSIPAMSLGGTGVSINGPNRGAEPKLISVSHQNTEVLSALVKLTGKDFGYDIPAWQLWLRTAYQPEAVPAKRVPQP
jgi:hypothetical protein